MLTEWNQLQTFTIDMLRSVITHGLNHEHPRSQILRLSFPLWNFLKFWNMNFNTFSDCMKVCSCFDCTSVCSCNCLYCEGRLSLWPLYGMLQGVQWKGSQRTEMRMLNNDRRKSMRHTASCLTLHRWVVKLYGVIGSFDCTYTVCCSLPVMWCCSNGTLCWRTPSVCLGSTESVMISKSGLRIRSGCYELMTRQIMWRLRSASLRWDFRAHVLMLLLYVDSCKVSFMRQSWMGCTVVVDSEGADIMLATWVRLIVALKVLIYKYFHFAWELAMSIDFYQFCLLLGIKL